MEAQYRIVDRVDDLCRLCTDLRERLSARQTCQSRIAEPSVGRRRSPLHWQQARTTWQPPPERVGAGRALRRWRWRRGPAGTRQQSTSENQAQRQATSSQNQSARQSTAKEMQNTRATTASNLQNNSNGNCNNCSDSDWDGGSAAVGFVAGAMVVGAATAATTPPPATVVVAAPAPAPVGPPCNVAPVAVNGVSYYQCGVTWYAAGYGSSGVVYMPVQPPPGY